MKFRSPPGHFHHEPPLHGSLKQAAETVFCDTTSHLDQTNTSLTVLLCGVAIGNPERHMRKASHCGSKQQQSSHAMITFRVR